MLPMATCPWPRCGRIERIVRAEVSAAPGGDMLPRVDLPELLLEAQDRTGYLDEFTHISGAGARIEDLPVSVAAVLVAEACNIGFRPVVNPTPSVFDPSSSRWCPLEDSNP
jgi:hypothetical protein